jgi:hypothetical protein
VRSQENSSFFSLVAGSGAGENYLSRLFQACFAKSASFRKIALSTIWKACALPKPVPEADNWVCDYQPSTWVPGGGRPDLCLRPGQAANVSKHIVLESKLGSRLTEQQLKNYKDHGTKVLIAVTKNRPEVPHKRLLEIGVKSLRWQDFCRALRQTAIAGQREKFICQSFAEYLEESGMAYREDITPKHLAEIAKLLKKLTAHGEIEFCPGQSFNFADNCLGLLDDVRASLCELLPKLDRWTCWGPGYFRCAPEEGEEMYHYLAFSLGIIPLTGTRMC